MFTFSDYIFNEFFTLYDKISDPNKDADGKGTHERFNEQIGAEMDAYLMPLVDNMQKNLLEPLTALDSFIPYLESMLGYDLSWLWFFTETLTFRRNLLRIIIRIYQIRGTRWAHEVMFAWLGLSVTVLETFPDDGRWDDGGTWDDGSIWDTSCPSCTSYSLVVTGTAPSLTSDQIAAIATIVEFNRPINAIYDGYVYNPFVDPLVLWTSPVSLWVTDSAYAIRPGPSRGFTMAFGHYTFDFAPTAFYSHADELTAIAYYNSLRVAHGMTGIFLIIGNDICYQQGAGEAWTIVDPILVKPKSVRIELLRATLVVAPPQNWRWDIGNSVGASLVVDYGGPSFSGGSPVIAYDVTIGGFPISYTYSDGTSDRMVHLFHDDTSIGILHFSDNLTCYRIASFMGDIPASMGTFGFPNGVIILEQKFSPANTLFSLAHCPNIENIELASCQITSFSSIFGINLPNLKFFNFFNNKLSSSEIDTLFNDFVANTPGFVANGVVYVQGQTPAAPPTAASLAARNALIANGWTLTTD